MTTAKRRIGRQRTTPPKRSEGEWGDQVRKRIGQAIAASRYRTKYAVAKAMGVNASRLTDWTSKNLPGAWHLGRLGDVLGVTTDWLLCVPGAHKHPVTQLKDGTTVTNRQLDELLRSRVARRLDEMRLTGKTRPASGDSLADLLEHQRAKALLAYESRHGPAERALRWPTAMAVAALTKDAVEHARDWAPLASNVGGRRRGV